MNIPYSFHEYFVMYVLEGFAPLQVANVLVPYRTRSILCKIWRVWRRHTTASFSTEAGSYHFPSSSQVRMFMTSILEYRAYSQEKFLCFNENVPDQFNGGISDWFLLSTQPPKGTRTHLSSTLLGGSLRASGAGRRWSCSRRGAWCRAAATSSSATGGSSSQSLSPTRRSRPGSRPDTMWEL